MRIWVCSILLLLAGCAADDTLNKVCPYQCIPDQSKMSSSSAELLRKKMGVGQCKYGLGVCDDPELEGHLTSCEGFVGPSIEFCDGVDNDCDGHVDDGVYNTISSRFPPLYHEEENFSNPCVEQYGSLVGECSSALVFCQDGKFICDGSGVSIELGDEVSCDGKDNDCDGKIDEDLFNGFCFDGDFWKTTHGACKAGLELCVNAQYVCEGQILPSIELCDGKDNDCNGIKDDTGDTLNTQYDIVFVIDTSGSMCSYISAVAAALDAYVEQFEANPNFRFAIVIMSTYGLELVTVDLDFTDLGTIRSRLLTIGCGGAGSEGSLDAMQMVCEDLNPLALTWGADANRLAFVFTDEIDQSFTSPATTKEDVRESCLYSGMLPFVWHKGFSAFTWIAGNTNGLDFQLEDEWEPILDDLNSVIITLCGSGT